MAALEKAGQQLGDFLTRHANREWGDLSDEDRKENDYSLEHGFRLSSVYRTHAGDILWIVMEAFTGTYPRFAHVKGVSTDSSDEYVRVGPSARQARTCGALWEYANALRLRRKFY